MTIKIKIKKSKYKIKHIKNWSIMWCGNQLNIISIIISLYAQSPNNYSKNPFFFSSSVSWAYLTTVTPDLLAGY